jgi:hypothetical protein
VCEALGWKPKDIYKLSDIEQGKVRPTRDDLDRLFLILRFAPQDRGRALLAAGIPPASEEAVRWVKRTQPILDAWAFPAYLIDFAWNLFAANDFAKQYLLGIRAAKKGAPGWQETVGRNLLDLAFDPDSSLFRLLHHGDPAQQARFLRSQVASFRVENIERTNEPWFQDLVLLLTRRPEFASIWNDLRDTTLQRLAQLSMRPTVKMTVPESAEDGLAEEFRLRLHPNIDFDEGAAPDAQSDRSGHSFYIFSERVTEDERFRVRLFLPVAAVTPLSEQREAFALPTGADDDVRALARLA